MRTVDSELRSMVEMELNALSMFSMCTNTRFIRLICNDARVDSRYPFFFVSARPKEYERTKRSISAKFRGRDEYQAFLFVFAYPSESLCVGEGIISLIEKGITVIDATKTPMEQSVNEAYALNMAWSKRYANHDASVSEEYLDKAYEALRPWTEKVVSSPVRVYDRGNPCGSEYVSLQAFYDRITADTVRTYPWSPDTMDLDGAFYRTIGARYFVRDGYFGKHNTDAPERSPERVFDFAWGNDSAWDDPRYEGEKVVWLKKAFDGYIEERLGRGERLSFKEIFEYMRKPPYGLLPNVIGAILMGMFFRTWMRRNLIWTNGFQQDMLDESHLLSMIENGIHNQHTQYRNSLVDYIMLSDTTTSRLKESLTFIFDLDRERSLFLPDLRSNVRTALEGLPYPVVSMRYADISGADSVFIDRLIAFVRSASDDEDGDVDKALAECLDAAAEANDDLPRRVREYLHGDKLKEGFEAMLARHGARFDPARMDRLSGLCGGNNAWKWIWQEESVIREMRCDG